MEPVEASKAIGSRGEWQLLLRKPPSGVVILKGDDWLIYELDGKSGSRLEAELLLCRCILHTKPSYNLVDISTCMFLAHLYLSPADHLGSIGGYVRFASVEELSIEC